MHGRCVSSIVPLAIVGGTYIERCRFPLWEEVYGSGLRAACACANQRSVHFHTLAFSSVLPNLLAAKKALGFKVQVQDSPKTFGFDYLHPLSKPTVTLIGVNAAAQPITVDSEHVLTFGMLEGDPIVKGKYVVFDPQNPLAPRHFIENGSQAEHLALVMNAVEACTLTGIPDIRLAGLELLSCCEVAVIKAGIQGAYVFWDQNCQQVSAYRTQRSFTIGSGDIFSAVFASLWTSQPASPLDAANQASLATAYYCDKTVLPLPSPLPQTFTPSAVSFSPETNIYLAAPFFTPAELWMVNEARTCLQQSGISVFSPFHDVGMNGTSESIATADIGALESADCVLAIVDGWDPGTIFEIGYARALNIPVVVVCTSQNSQRLLMLEGSGCEIVSDLASGIYRAAWR